MKKLLTRHKTRWAKNRDVTLRGLPLNYSAPIAAEYERALKQLIAMMTKTTKKEVAQLFKRLPVHDSAMDDSLGSQARILMNKLTERFTELFNYHSSKLAKKLVSKTMRYGTTTLHRSLKQLSGGLSLKTSIISSEVEDVSKSLIAENVSLIKSIPEEYFKQITGTVMRSIQEGGLFDLVPAIKKYDGMTDRRAKLIAHDQTRKAYTSINKAKCENLGITHFEWLHTGGSQSPRPSHEAISGMVFSFENLINEQARAGVPKRDRGLPGFPVNCKCRILPVIDLDNK